MNVQTLCALINAKIVTQDNKYLLDVDCEHAFASDLMSDVLCLTCENVVLITGLCNIQTVRTADMADFKVIVLARGKKADENMITLAEENEIIICETEYSVFKTSGILYINGLKAIF